MLWAAQPNLGIDLRWFGLPAAPRGPQVAKLRFQARCASTFGEFALLCGLLMKFIASAISPIKQSRQRIDAPVKYMRPEGVEPPLHGY